MLGSISKIARSWVVAMVNFCFLCGAGHLLDMGTYVFKRSANRCQVWWRFIARRTQLKRQ